MEGTLDYRWQKNGMALGGIGAGSVEICQNGELREWDICNMGKWGSPDVRKQKKLYDYDAHVLPFTVRAGCGKGARLYAYFVMTGTTANFGH